MLSFLRRIAGVAVLLVVLGTLTACGGFIKGDGRHLVPLSGEAKARLARMGSSPGEAMMLRIYKQSSELEVWKRTASGEFKLFQTYEICAWSGELGPNVKEGDRQAPEGFYTITPGLLNPRSNYHLAFNTGFPNKFDRAWGRTGSDLMVHGDCSSRGCFAMTDEQIAEIYALARESFAGGNPSFQLQIFPFRMTPENLAKQSASPHLAYWKNLKEGFDRFELSKRPPVWDVCEKRYVFDVPRRNGQVLDAAGACPAEPGGDETLVAALAAKQAADDAAMAAAAQSFAQKEARAATEAERLAREKEALQAREQAISSVVTGFIGGLFGGGKDENVQKVIDPELVAPIPAPRIKRV